MRLRVLLLVLPVLLGVSPAGASWSEVVEAESQFDLSAARAAALETVAGEADSAAAVAAAMWWLSQLDNLWQPTAILAAADEGAADPELALVLERIRAELTAEAPAGALVEAELAGPFGSYSTLDLDRWVVPADSHLPPLGTPWKGPTAPYRLPIRSASGRHSPPELMSGSGVYLAAWTIELPRQLDGWLVVEALGGFNLEVDGRSVARLRNCGRDDPALSWYSFHGRPGEHRIRVEFSSQRRPELRVSLLEQDGSAASFERGTRQVGPWSASEVEPAEAPAAARLARELNTPDSGLQQLLLGAALARGRGDPRRVYRLLQRALELAPEDPLVHLENARLLLTQPLGFADDEADRRTGHHLRQARSLPLAALYERALAARQDRNEDQERILDQLVEKRGDDPRVLRLWASEAVRRGWIPEAEAAMEQLLALLPDSHAVQELRLAVLEKLERWQERNELLLELSAEGALTPHRVEQLANGCFAERALKALRALGQETDDPVLDLGIVRLLLELGQTTEARAELARAREHWGAIPAINRLNLVAAAGREDLLELALAEALADHPADLDLRALAWRRGLEPFFAPYRVDGLEMLEALPPPPQDVDSEVVLDQAVEHLFMDGSSLYYYHGLTRALTPEGARQASVLQQMPDALLLKVRIIKPDGSIVVPPELDSRNGTLVLNGVKERDVVEEEYVAALAPSHPALNGHISPYVYRFADPERAFGRSEYLILYPSDLDLRVDGNTEGLERSEWRRDGRSGLHFLAEQMPPLPSEPLAPPAQELLPWVTLGANVSWQDVADSLRDRILPVLGSNPDLEDWGRRVLADLEDPEAQLQALAEALFAQVEPGQADLELRLSAGASFSHGSGNRLAIIASVLVDAGWQVELLLARPKPFAGSHLAVPSLEAFSLPLLRLEHRGTTLWVDLSEERSGINHINPMIQGSDALRLPLWSAQEEAGLEPELPSFPNPDLEERIRVAAALAADGTARLRYTRRARGSQAESLYQRLSSLPEEQQPVVFSQLAASLYSGADQVTGSATREGDEVVLALELELPGACEWEAGEISCEGLLPVRPLVPALASLPERRYPLILQLPFSQRFELHLELPPGFSPAWRERLLHSEWGSVGEELSSSGRKVVSVLRLHLPAQRVEPESYLAFTRFCHAVDELMTRDLVLERSSP